jgi:aminoglycoside 6'-N-acetyltransferase I
VVFVADRPGTGRLAGFLEAEGCSSSPVAYIEGWYVDPDHRRCGVGTALVRAAEEWARGLGLSEIASDTEVDNTLGHQAHVSLGYQDVKRIVCYRKPLKRAD